MKSHAYLTDMQFEHALASCQLDPDVFDHEAHVRIAWIHIHKYGVETAIQQLTDQLKRYTHHLGNPEKYHHTLTIAAIRAVNHFIRKYPESDFISFRQASPELFDHFSQLLATHYSVDLFSDVKARRQFLEPDLSPF